MIGETFSHLLHRHPADQDQSQHLLEQVQDALASNTPLSIVGHGSKAFLGRPTQGRPLSTSGHRGIVHYDPTELVISARAGTPLAVLEQALAEHDQLLPFEPPSFAAQATLGGATLGGATLGGAIAAGLSGPRRPWSGAARDFVLGTRMISGQGKLLRFGGEVMKNVAGYDLSRLLAGSFGCLGLITEVSLKVLPRPRLCTSLRLECAAADALQRLAEWGQQPLPISGASHHDGALYLRLEGGEGSVQAARARLGGDEVDSGYWQELREHRLAFFQDPRPLWRLSLPPTTPPLELPGVQLIDWGGAQRWLKSDAETAAIRAAAAAAGGHASCFTAGVTDTPFHPLPAGLLRYHRQLKAQLDPQGIFNPGRLYAEV